ncbi:MAG TPA: hypothetical protein PLD27_04520 [bacterium]|nr:hypothetical protein [bacterium]HOL46834.1 hypothetical protein [bacterium]HPQ18640.1 hypothetical protein [bacterium]
MQLFKIFLFFIFFIFIILAFFSFVDADKKLKLTEKNYLINLEHIKKYKAIKGKFPDTLENLISDTYIENGQTIYFTDNILPEYLSGKFSNKVKIGFEPDVNGNGWLYDKNTGNLKINNKKIRFQYSDLNK